MFVARDWRQVQRVYATTGSDHIAFDESEIGIDWLTKRSSILQAEVRMISQSMTPVVMALASLRQGWSDAIRLERVIMGGFQVLMHDRRYRSTGPLGALGAAGVPVPDGRP